MEQLEVSTNGGKSFPNKVLRVMAIDDDIISLKIFQRLLFKCGYIVTVAQHAHDALKLLQENKDEYDTVITGINTPEMEGFELLENFVLEADLALIAVSVDCDVMSEIKGTRHNAVHYLVKPVQLEELKVIWKLVGRKSFQEMKEPSDPIKKLDHTRTAQKFLDSRPIREHKKHRNERDDDVEDDDTTTGDSDEETPQKKPRISWNKRLHSKFIDAINQLGLDRAVPKKILEIMNIPGLSRENVASHLQKHRRGLKKKGMGLEEHFKTNTSSIDGSADITAINNQCPPISSFKTLGDIGYKCTSGPFASFPTQRSHNGQAALLPTRCPHPFSQNNDFGRQYPNNTQSNQLITGRQSMICPQTSQSAIENSDLMTNYLENSVPTQASSNELSYMPFPSRPNQQNSCTQTSQIHFPHNRNSSPSSAQHLGYADGLDDNLLIELNAMLQSEQEQQEFSSCSGLDVEIGTLINNEIADIHSNVNEDLEQSSLWDLPYFPAEISPSEIASWNDAEYEEVLN